MDTFHIALYGIGALPVLLFLRYILTAQNLLGQVLKKPSGRLIQRAECPPYLHDFYKIKEKELIELGFRFFYCHITGGMFLKKSPGRYYFVYYNRAKKSYASLTASPEADAYIPFRVSFHSYFKDGKKLETSNLRHKIIGTLPHTIFQHAPTASLVEQWMLHLDYLEKINRKEIKVFAETREGIEEVMGYENRVLSDHFDQLERKGFIRKSKYEDDKYLVRTLPSLLIARQLLRDGRISKSFKGINKKTEQKEEEVDIPVQVEVENYFNFSYGIVHKKKNIPGKIFFLLLTFILFFFAFWFFFSFEFVLLLLVVVSLHEGGHLLAMFFLGYKDLKMLFIPLFGAVAMGSDKGIPVYKKVITYFAGPVPGILLAFLLLALRSTTAVTALLLLFFVNYSNLLPLMPLDGGQLLNTVIFSRFMVLQSVFLIISIIVFIGIALFFNAPVLLVIALIIPFAYRSQFLRGTLTARLNNRLRNIKDKENKSNTDVMIEVFTALKEEPYNRYTFKRKIRVAQYVEDHVSAANPSLKTVVFTVLVYAFVIFLPIIFFLSPLFSTDHFLLDDDPCAFVQGVEMPGVPVDASRFQRVYMWEGGTSSFICYRYCFLPGGEEDFPAEPAADFLSRLWALYGKPDFIANGFSYTLMDRKTNLIFTAHCSNFVSLYGGYGKNKKDINNKSRLVKSLYLFDRLLRETEPADCDLGVWIDLAKYGYENLQEGKYKVEYRIGSRNGTPYIKMIPPLR